MNMLRHINIYTQRHRDTGAYEHREMQVHIRIYTYTQIQRYLDALRHGDIGVQRCADT